MKLQLKPVRSAKDIRLDDADARVRGRHTEAALERAAAKQVERISELQRVLYADGRHALLIVLQGRDASGKVLNAIAKNVPIEDASTSVAQGERGNWQLFDAYNGRNVIEAYRRLEWE